MNQSLELQTGAFLNGVNRMSDIVLQGCSPVPLAHYLKALGILRLVSEQKDSDAKGYWAADSFVLRSKLNQDELKQFLLNEYKPTPIIAPWNGGSGFYPKDDHDAIMAINQAKSKRFDRYVEVLTQIKLLFQRLSITEKIEKERKDELLLACRANLSDFALDWLDAAFMLTTNGTSYPPLLGTGGNDGRLEFTNNFMQRLISVITPESGEPVGESAAYLETSLSGSIKDNLISNAAVGQFSPSAAGGANASTGFDSESLINPWDYILMLEGSMLFAAASSRKLENSNPGVLSYPFSVRSSGVGYGSSSISDEHASRAEIWMPIWKNPANLSEIRHIFSEGRAKIGRRQVVNGTDFIRAISSLGVDRGINEFQRYGFQERNGMAYFAIPLGRFKVKREPNADLLMEIDSWHEKFRRAASGDKAPASAQRALRNLEDAIFKLCKDGSNSNVQATLIALGECEQVMATSAKWREDAYLKPIYSISGEWVKKAYDGSAEFRLAESLASIWGVYGDKKMPLRNHFEPPVCRNKNGDAYWKDNGESNDVVWIRGNPIRSINAILSRRFILAAKAGIPKYSDRTTNFPKLSDISDFIDGNVDLIKLEDILIGLILVDWSSVKLDSDQNEDGSLPTAPYSIMKMCYANGKVNEVEIPLVANIHAKASSGDISGAVQLATRRLRGSGLTPLLETATTAPEKAQRIAAALLFPISYKQIEVLSMRVIKEKEQS